MTSIVCQNCGIGLGKTMLFCPSCGHNVAPSQEISKDEFAYEFFKLGLEKWKLGDLKSALVYYTQSVDILITKNFLTVDDWDIIEDLGDIHRLLENYEDAIFYYKKSACNIKIAHIYYENLKDFDNSFKIYLNDTDNPSAAHCLAKMTWKGEGTEQNLIDALKWMNIAISKQPNSIEFQRTINAFKLEMTTDEIQKANLRSAIWLKRREIIKKNNLKPWLQVGL